MFNGALAPALLRSACGSALRGWLGYCLSIIGKLSIIQTIYRLNLSVGLQKIASKLTNVLAYKIELLIILTQLIFRFN